jgi:acyl-CoA thioester hydrolase
MNPSAEILFEVPFYDVDAMGVVWQGHYYKYFELARTELFRKFHCDVEDLRAMGLVLPVIESHCRYLAPLIYGMRVRAKASLVETEFRLGVDYLLTAEPGTKRLAKGWTFQAVVRRADMRLLFPVPTQIIDLFPKDPCAQSA